MAEEKPFHFAPVGGVILAVVFFKMSPARAIEGNL